VTLHELADLLRDYATSEMPLAAIHDKLHVVLIADPLDVTASDPSRWEMAPDDERLFWRLVYVFDSETDDGPHVRDLARRIVESLAGTGSSATHELLPILLDQPRLCAIVTKYQHGIISRTGFLSVVAECGYPSHIKLWLEHASPAALTVFCERLGAYRYREVAAGFEGAPG
jgi:hypothetical protein